VQVASLYAGVLASLAGWMIGDSIQPYLGTATALVLSFAGSVVVFFAARRWLINLRGR
jgi:hypothetical protein